jgi:hypothetical protein
MVYSDQCSRSADTDSIRFELFTLQSAIKCFEQNPPYQTQMGPGSVCLCMSKMGFWPSSALALNVITVHTVQTMLVNIVVTCILNIVEDVSLD